jgi:hypothetical protein
MGQECPSSIFDLPSCRATIQSGVALRFPPRSKNARTLPAPCSLLPRLAPHYHRINLPMISTTAGSSGNITGNSFVRTTRSPSRLAKTLTGQPHAL